MNDAVKRTQAWREQKREEGYQPVTLWIPAKVKNALVNLAFQRHQDLGEVIVEAFQAWSPAKSAGAGSGLTQAQVKALIQAQLAEALASHAVPSVAPLPTDPAPQPATLPQPATGMKQCGKGHTYPASKKECPQCGRLRTQKNRQRKAEARRGEIPT